MYTIGQIAEMFHIPVSTLRYYDKEGLFINMERTSGIRRFGRREIEAMFRQQKEAVEAEMARMEKTLDMIRFKCWYYEQALQDGNEERLSAILPDKLPEEIQQLYDHAHSS